MVKSARRSEKLLRYFLRPPIATERFCRLRDASVAYRAKYGREYGRGSKTHRIMQRMEAMARRPADRGVTGKKAGRRDS